MDKAHIWIDHLLGWTDHILDPVAVNQNHVSCHTKHATQEKHDAAGCRIGSAITQA